MLAISGVSGEASGGSLGVFWTCFLCVFVLCLGVLNLGPQIRIPWNHIYICVYIYVLCCTLEKVLVRVTMVGCAREVVRKVVHGVVRKVVRKVVLLHIYRTWVVSRGFVLSMASMLSIYIHIYIMCVYVQRGHSCTTARVYRQYVTHTYIHIYIYMYIHIYTQTSYLIAL